MKKRMCPCGGTEFKATRIFQADVICDGAGKPINHIGFYEDHTTGPYTCQKCGTQFESLEDLVSVQQSMTLTVGFPGETPTKLSVASDGTITENVKDAITGFYKALGNDLSKTEGIHPICVDDGEDTILYGLLCVKPDNVSIKLGNLEDGMPSEWEPITLDESEESGIDNQYQCKEVLLSMEALSHHKLLCGLKVIKDYEGDLYCGIVKPGGAVFYSPRIVRAKILAEAGSFIAVDIPNETGYTFMLTQKEFEDAVIRYKGLRLYANYHLRKSYEKERLYLGINLSYEEWMEEREAPNPITREDIESAKSEVYQSKRTIDPRRILSLMPSMPPEEKVSMRTLAQLTLTYGGFFVHDKTSNQYSFKYLAEEEDPEKWFRRITWAKIIEEEGDKVRLLLKNTKGDYLIDLLLTPQEFEKCRIKYSLPKAWGILPGWDELLSEYDLRQYYREKVRTSSRPLPPYEKWRDGPFDVIKLH